MATKDCRVVVQTHGQFIININGTIEEVTQQTIDYIVDKVRQHFENDPWRRTAFGAAFITIETSEFTKYAPIGDRIITTDEMESITGEMELVEDNSDMSLREALERGEATGGPGFNTCDRCAHWWPKNGFCERLFSPTGNQYADIRMASNEQYDGAVKTPGNFGCRLFERGEGHDDESDV